MVFGSQRVIIAGSRGFDNYTMLKRRCDEVIKNNKFTKIVSGGARGADRLGEQYAKERGFDLEVMKADWDRFGKSAGYRRNVQMANQADVLIAFWDGVSRGTKHMIDIANEKGLYVAIIKFGENGTATKGTKE